MVAIACMLITQWFAINQQAAQGGKVSAPSSSQVPLQIQPRSSGRQGLAGESTSTPRVDPRSPLRPRSTPSSKYDAAASDASKTGTQSGALPNDHVCTDACTHEGATKGKSTSPSAQEADKAVPAAAKSGNDATARGSCEGRPPASERRPVRCGAGWRYSFQVIELAWSRHHSKENARCYAA